MKRKSNKSNVKKTQEENGKTRTKQSANNNGVSMLSPSSHKPIENSVSNSQNVDVTTSEDEAKIKRDASFSRYLFNIENGRFDDPCHKIRPSLFSSTSGYTNYRGLLNLCIVLLLMSTSRLVLENIIKYGFLVRFDVPMLFIKDPTAWPSLLAVVCSNIFILAAYLIEKLIISKKLNPTFGFSLGIVNGLLALTLPALYLWGKASNPVSSFMALSTYSCVSLKIFSYIHVNKMCRDLSSKTKLVQSPNKDDLNNDVQPIKDNLVQYPNNVTIKDLYYFFFAPTLCYELNYPRSERIHLRFLVRRIGEIAFLVTLQLICIQQWIVPILKNSKLPFAESNSSKIAERLLKLAVPNHVIWVIFFYSFFHSWLNILAELLRFGDREFYRDWWNAENVNEFWQNWNIPVHKYCVRHIYKPLVRFGASKLVATAVVFFVSAFFHEYLVSLPLRMFRLWAFFGMLFQVPFALFVKRFLHGHYGNMALWVSLIIGQPLAILMYIHDYYIDYFKNL